MKTLNKTYGKLEVQVNHFPTENTGTQQENMSLRDGAMVDLLALEIKTVLPEGKVIVDFPIIQEKYKGVDLAKRARSFSS